jgi:cyclophilin family peptidyl-prolyl cis-trans isomerase
MSRLPRRIVLAAAGFALLIAACGGDASTATTVAPSTTAALVPLTSGRPPTDYAGFLTQPTACGAEQPPPLTEMQFAAPDDVGISPDDRPRATVMTSCGEIVIELDPSVAPQTVNSFVFLAESGYFDGTAAHRVVPGFVIQAGDPEASGRGGPGYAIPDEAPAPDFVYEKGMVAMANAGPGTSGSQFFVMLDDVQFPPEFRFNFFGRLVDGQDTIDRIAALPLGANPGGEVSTPLETVYIEGVTIER